jgi:negative regulator of replication initiation
MKTIRISEEVYGQIAKRGSFGETPDDVLRRAFKLPEKSRPTPMRGRRTSGATDPLSAWVEGNQLHVKFQSGNSESWDLPSKNDKNGIRGVRDQAAEFADAYGATLGQVNAVKKALTNEGYWLTK